MHKEQKLKKELEQRRKMREREDKKKAGKLAKKLLAEIVNKPKGSESKPPEGQK